MSTVNSELSVSRAGFTLLEITIVIIIMGIALGIVGMVISKDRGSLEAKIFTKELSAVLRRARSNAVTEKKTYCFVIDKEERVFRLYTDKAKDKDDDGESGKFTVVTSKSIPEGLEMIVRGNDSDFPFIEFFPQGNSTGGVLEITNEKGTTYFISVNMITGKLDVEKAE